jgi:hypothetical protein
MVMHITCTWVIPLELKGRVVVTTAQIFLSSRTKFN